MDIDPLDFLGNEETNTAVSAEPTPAPEPTPETAQAEAPTEGPVRDDKGRFASKTEPTAEAPAEAAPQAPAPMPEAVQQASAEPPKAPDGYVPVAVVQEMRRKIQALEQATQQPPPPAPDLYEDPEGFVAHQQQQMAGVAFNWSYKLLTAQHGEQTAEQVRQWAAQKADTDPQFYQRAMSTEDPFGFAMDEWKRDQVLSKLSDPALLDRFLAFATAQAAPQQTAAPMAAAPPSPAAPPPSITSVPSAGGVQHVPLGQKAIFDAVIN